MATRSPSLAAPRAPRAATSPDLLVRSGGGLVAVELELTPKRTRRLRAILKAYRRADNIASVLYVSDRRAVLAHVERLARELHLENKLATQTWHERR